MLQVTGVLYGPSLTSHHLGSFGVTVRVEWTTTEVQDSKSYRGVLRVVDLC